jgi:hypothetical protein
MVVSSNLREGRLEPVPLATPNRQVAEVDQNLDGPIVIVGSLCLNERLDLLPQRRLSAFQLIQMAGARRL